MVDVPGDAQGLREAWVFPARLVTAIVQAVGLYLLCEAAIAPQAWPATAPVVFQPLLLVFSFIPLLTHLGLGQIPVRPLANWLGVATLIVIGLGVHSATRGSTLDYGSEENLLPWLQLWLMLAAALFIGHVLVVDSIIERRILSAYGRHFDTAWKQGVQAALTVVFVGVVWGVLELGAGLFKLLDIDFFVRLLDHLWFDLPATTLAIAVAIHLTDIQPALIRGARSLALGLFSWLLPLLAAILLGFLGSLPFVSLAPLWSTHFAGGLLLIAAAAIVFLINCCYQDGAAERTGSQIKRLSVRIGAIELVPLVALAVWALGLRVEQHGWTVDRILAAAVTSIAACYAVGYAGAAVLSPTWMKRIEIANFVTGYLALAVGLMLFSPAADPARLMVADQLARLRSGAIKPAQFDFAALKFDGARWGAAALDELSRTRDGPEAATISDKAQKALALKSYWNPEPPETSGAVADRINILTPGHTLPADFYGETSDSLFDGTRPTCLHPANLKCLVRFVTLRPEDAEAIIFLDDFAGYVFERDSAGKWRKTGDLETTGCPSIRKGFEDNDPQLAPHAQPDLVIGDRHIAIHLSVPCSD